VAVQIQLRHLRAPERRVRAACAGLAGHIGIEAASFSDQTLAVLRQTNRGLAVTTLAARDFSCLFPQSGASPLWQMSDSALLPRGGRSFFDVPTGGGALSHSRHNGSA